MICNSIQEVAMKEIFERKCLCLDFQIQSTYKKTFLAKIQSQTLLNLLRYLNEIFRVDPELEGDNLNHHLALIRSLAART